MVHCVYIKIGSVCPSVCAMVSASINPLPNNRLHCRCSVEDNVDVLLKTVYVVCLRQCRWSVEDSVGVLLKTMWVVW